jgi:predicted TIM-barrel fold metal-dependent hydrolase
MAYANLRGIRDFGQGDYLADPAWQDGYRLLARHGLVFCLDVIPENLGKARALAELVPDVVLCIDHAGFPRSREPDYFEMWKRGMSDAAGAPNVVCKVSGLGMCDNRWTVESLRPWVLACIEAFGAARTFFGTNWPVDRLYSSYGDVLNAYEEIIAGLSEDEQRALFSENAERIFRI